MLCFIFLQFRTHTRHTKNSIVIPRSSNNSGEETNRLEHSGYSTLDSSRAIIQDNAILQIGDSETRVMMCKKLPAYRSSNRRRTASSLKRIESCH